MAKEGVYLPQELMWRARSPRELTWRAGPPRRCNAALRPRSRAVGGPREAQVAHKARTCGKRPCVSTGPRRRPCGAPRGRRGSAFGGPGKMIGGVMQ